MPLLPWVITAEQELYRTRVFTILGHRAQSQLNEAKQGSFVVLDAPDWVNVIALTQNNEVVMVRQFRHGSREITLELPGGMCDPGEDFIVAGQRELREETGAVGENAQLIGVVEPNPAIQNNRCGTILVRDVTFGAQSLDHNEEIEVTLIPLDQISSCIQQQQITHSLVVAAFYHALSHLK